jgi:hypothetical protein
MTNLSEATHDLSVLCNNSARTLSSTAIVSFVIDLTEPTITIVLPQNITYGITAPFNVTTGEPARGCNSSYEGDVRAMTNSSLYSWAFSYINVPGSAQCNILLQ